MAAYGPKRTFKCGYTGGPKAGIEGLRAGGYGPEMALTRIALYVVLALIVALLIGATWFFLMLEIPPVAALPLYALGMATLIALALGVSRIGRKPRA